MSIQIITRRKFLAGATGAAAATSFASMPFGRSALAQKTQLVGVTWGGPWLDGAKEVTGKDPKYQIKWELHTGGSAAIIPKIKAAWPNVAYDFVGQFSPLYITWVKEDWAEPLSPDEMPNLKDIPDYLFHRNAAGQIVTVPISLGGAFWGYRKDLTPFPIKKMEDLLDPRLKGKVVVRDATQGLNNNGISYAVAFGGNEKNMEPGWEFLKKLAKSGNIARVGKTEVDFINALTSGEGAVGFWNIGAWGTVAKSFPCEFLIKEKKEVPGFQVFTFNEGFLIPKASRNKKEAKEYLNFFVNPENNQLYNEKYVNYSPVNRKSKPGELAKVITFKTTEEHQRFAYDPDWAVLSPLGVEMIQRFEKEIVPLLR
jgi:putative spermidine/putrescine transport system substrate-binding protein